MEHARRIGILAAASALLGAAAFAACTLLDGFLAVVLGVALVAGSALAAAFAYVAARTVTARTNRLREATEAMTREGSYGGRLQAIKARDEVDALHNAVAELALATYQPLQTLTAGAEAIAGGDLTVRLDAQGNGGTGNLVRRFGDMRDALKRLVGEVQGNAMEVTSSAEELSAAIEEISSSIEEVSATIQQVTQGAQSQSEQVAQASHSLRQTSDQLQRTADEARQAAERVRATDESAAGGSRSAEVASRRVQEITARVDEAAGMVRGFAESIARIRDFVDLIVRISDQTNLLALNAAIEAARAGEHGRGFTVVADEVRKLAEESARGAEEIQRVIGHVTSETTRVVATMESMAADVGEGDKVVREAIGRFREVTDQVGQVSGLVARIAASVDEVARRGTDVARNVESITASAEETAASAEEVSAALEEQTASIEQVASTSQGLARTAAATLESMRRFRTGESAETRPRREPRDVPPVFRPPSREKTARGRLPLTTLAEERQQETWG